jgi:hypothetical protein
LKIEGILSIFKKKQSKAIPQIFNIQSTIINPVASNKQQATSNKQQATSNKQQAISNEKRETRKKEKKQCLRI